MKELILISGLGVLALLAGLINGRKFFMPIVLIGLSTNIGFSLADWGSNEMVYGMLKLDNFALAFNIVFSAIAFLWFISAYEYFTDDNNFSDHFALVLFTLTGAFLLVSFTNMITLFLGIEILSIPLFVLVGSNKTKLKSNEAAFKYFLLGSFASAFLLFGMALIYGSTGSFDLAIISGTIAKSTSIPPMYFAGMLLMLMSIAFKVSAAPFHFWAPDAYEGAPTNITAYMATVVKTVAFAAFFRLFYSAFGSVHSEYALVLSIMCAITLIVANITAAVQANVKRMMAYSSISHAGFMLIAIFTLNAANLLLYYTLVYSISSIIVFTVIKIVKAYNSGNDSINAFKGLLKQNPILAGCLIVALLSMAGIPPLAGFMAKYFMFTTLVSNGYLWLVVIAILTSLVGVYYYFKVIIAVFQKPETENDITLSFAHKFILIICALALLVISIVPDMILGVL